jgi:hypothetical protein
MATGTTRSRRATKSATENELTDLFMDGPLAEAGATVPEIAAIIGHSLTDGEEILDAHIWAGQSRWQCPASRNWKEMAL